MNENEILETAEAELSKEIEQMEIPTVIEKPVENSFIAEMLQTPEGVTKTGKPRKKRESKVVPANDSEKVENSEPDFSGLDIDKIKNSEDIEQAIEDELKRLESEPVKKEKKAKKVTKAGSEIYEKEAEMYLKGATGTAAFGIGWFTKSPSAYWAMSNDEIDHFKPALAGILEDIGVPSGTWGKIAVLVMGISAFYGTKIAAFSEMKENYEKQLREQKEMYEQKIKDSRFEAEIAAAIAKKKAQQAKKQA